LNNGKTRGAGDSKSIPAVPAVGKVALRQGGGAF
jgi:hypothetical protein